MYEKVKKVIDEFKSQFEDIKRCPELYGIMLGLQIYQIVAYFVIGLIPFALLKIFVWCFFMLIFWLIFLVIETPITFTQVYHIAVIWVIQFFLAMDINTNPITLFIIFELLLRRTRQYIYDSLSAESLLPYALKDLTSTNSSRDKVNISYEFGRLFIALWILLPNRNDLAPMLLSRFAAPWCLFPSEFPIFYCALLWYVYSFKSGKKQIITIMVGCVLYWIIWEPSKSLSIIWHFCTASFAVFWIKRFPLLTVIVSIYGGITFYAFSFFPLLANCTTMYN